MTAAGKIVLKKLALCSTVLEFICMLEKHRFDSNSNLL